MIERVVAISLRRRTWLGGAAVLVFAATLVQPLEAQSSSTAARPKSTPATAADSVFVRTLFNRLIAVTPKPRVSYPWPPHWFIEGKPGEVNAYATPDGRVVVTPDMLHNVINGNADLLAFVIGHELGHHIMGHVESVHAQRSSNTALLGSGKRHDETEADSVGAQLAIAAGYSWQRILKGINESMGSMGEYPGFVALRLDHPSWTDRAAFVNGIRGDKGQVALWQSMSAFRNGNYFLMVEQFDVAARSFRSVTKEFPDAAEAWANLGYALLMQYCDKLEPEDLRRYDIGQPVVAAFYKRPVSLEAKVRGVDQELWWEAVGALREAVRLRPSLSLAKSHLGLAYLVHPSGTKDVGTAARMLQEAVAAAPNDSMIDATGRVAIYVNAGVAQLAAGRPSEAMTGFTQARAYARNAFAADGPRTPAGLLGAIDFNEGWLQTRSASAGQEVGAAKLEQWLAKASPSSAWWQLAYDRYAKAMTAAGKTPTAAAVLRHRDAPMFRPIVAIALGGGGVVTLSEPTAGMRARLGRAVETPAVAGTNVVWLDYPERGTKVLASAEVLAVSLTGDKAAPLMLRPSSLGSPPVSIRVGMTVAQLSAVIGDDFEMKRLQDDAPAYRYYRQLGLGVHVKDGVVDELFIAQLPESDV